MTEMQDPSRTNATTQSVRKRWRRLIGTFAGIPLLVGVLAAAGSFLIRPVFTSTTTFLPPQQQGSLSSSLASLGALAGLAGSVAGVKSPADQYVALLQSVSVSDNIIDRFDLLNVYASKLRIEAQEELTERVRISVGKKDGLISISVDDHDPKRAADMANQFVQELRIMNNRLALTEAQQRRVFFEARLNETKNALTSAQVALQKSGFNSSVIRAEPKAAAEAYARLKAELTSAEVKLQTMQTSLAGSAPEVLQQTTQVRALAQRLALLEAESKPGNDADYLGRFREFKYQETLFDLMARQYELARIDESREGALIQVVDAAAPAERKSRPRRALIAVSAMVATWLGLVILALWRRQSGQQDDLLR